MRMKKMQLSEHIGTYIIGTILLLLAAFLLFPPFPTEAADAQSITLKDATARLSIGETKTIQVDYSKLKGGYADLGIAVSDPSLIQAALHDAGNSQAVLTIQAQGFGTASVAVYAVSNPAIGFPMPRYTAAWRKKERYIR